jgi:hypothetical protein
VLRQPPAERFARLRHCRLTFTAAEILVTMILCHEPGVPFRPIPAQRVSVAASMPRANGEAAAHVYVLPGAISVIDNILLHSGATITRITRALRTCASTAKRYLPSLIMFAARQKSHQSESGATPRRLHPDGSR